MLKIFVSSTFQDMHMERDCLEDIQQDLNAQFLESGERIEFVDLRWGICTEELDEEGRNKAILEGCFSAIDKSDYLLVFLGNRYGSIKSYDEVVGYLGKKKTDVLFEKADAGKSVTELEVAYAQFVKGFDSNNTVVCIRDEQKVEKEAQRFIDSFAENKAYETSILHYSNDNSTDFRTNLKNQLSKLIKNHIANNTGFDRDRRRLENLAVDAVLNQQIASLKIENQMIIFSGESGIGKTTTAAEILRRNYGEKLIPFVTWGAKETKLTYEQILDMLAERFSERFLEAPDKNDINCYIKKCVSRITDAGYEFVIFLDSEENISGIKYRQLLDLIGKGHLFISTTRNYKEILSGISSFSDYKVLDEENVLFRTDEIAGVIKNEFDEHGKNIRPETIDILVRKTDILKPLYLHFAVKRLLFLKAHDFEKCASNESPEVKVLSEIAKELPDSLDELLTYSMKNAYENSDIPLQMGMVIALFSESYKGVTEDVIIDYLIYKNVGSSKSEIMPYVYEIRNRLDDFIATDGVWYNRRFTKEVYNWIADRTDIRDFVESQKTNYKNEYFIREYMYWNRDNAESLYSFLSARALWKSENTYIRTIYRNWFWILVEDGYIKAVTLDEQLFIKLFDEYDNTDEYYTGQICTKDPVFRLLSEGIEKEIRNYQEGDSIVFLLRIAEVYIEELIWIYNSGILTCLDDIPMDVLNVFEKLSFVYKIFAKTLLSTQNSEWDLERIYKALVEQTTNNSHLINSLSCAEMLIEAKDNRSVTYYHNAVRLLSAADFLVDLGIYDKRYSTDSKICGNGIYFNWRYKSPKVFDTVRYMLMYTLSKWVGDFSTGGSQFAMDIVAVDYYLNYSARTEIMTAYNDALMLLLVLVYEVYHLSHFRKYKKSIEGYWIKKYPYTRLECCSNPEDVNGDDYEIRKTVTHTINELGKALKRAYVSEDVGLKEKCTLDLLGTKSLSLMFNLEMSEKHSVELLLPLIDLLKETKFLKEALENEDLHDYLPIEYILDDDKDVIRQAVKELNLNCI